MTRSNDLSAAIARQSEGELDGPEAVYRSVLLSDPTNHAALHFLGLIEITRGESEVGLDLIRQSINYFPSRALYRSNYGQALHQLGKFEEAVTQFDVAIKLQPASTELQVKRSNALSKIFQQASDYEQEDRLEEALSKIDWLVNHEPDNGDFVNFRAALLFSMRRYHEALDNYEALSHVEGGSFRLLFGRGSCFLSLGDPLKAIQDFNRCLECHGSSAEIFSNRGSANLAIGALDDAERDFDSALRLSADFPAAHFNRSLVWLARGDYLAGFREYEWGWVNGKRGVLKYPRVRPWRGENLMGRRLLIFDEQGMGDVIQFSRFIELVAALGAVITFAVRSELHRLLGGLLPRVEVVTYEVVDEGRFDYSCALMSIPGVLGITIDRVCPRMPYLFSEVERVDIAANFLCPDTFNVGVCSQGSRGVPIDFGRSFPLTLFRSLSNIPRVRLYSLQKIEPSWKDLNAEVDFVVPFPSGFDRDGAFVDTAALIQKLDLTITSDTAIAHLAGALGKAVWVVLKKVPDWRWGVGRADCPWYPTMKLFRQTDAGQWGAPILEIRRALQSLVSEDEAKQ